MKTYNVNYSNMDISTIPTEEVYHNALLLSDDINSALNKFNSIKPNSKLCSISELDVPVYIDKSSEIGFSISYKKNKGKGKDIIVVSDTLESAIKYTLEKIDNSITIYQVCTNGDPIIGLV